MDCHFLLQGIFPTQGSNLGLLRGRQDALPSEPPGTKGSVNENPISKEFGDTAQEVLIQTSRPLYRESLDWWEWVIKQQIAAYYITFHTMHVFEVYSTYLASR